jgi:16S rRNA (guanine966-N2)-methyltransferase
MDPPYNLGHIPPILKQITALQLLQQNGIIFAESAIDEQLELPISLELIETRSYGSSKVHLICNQTSNDDETVRPA